MTTTALDSVSVRSAERADLQAVFRLEQASFPKPWLIQSFEGFLGDPGFLVAVGDKSDAAGLNCGIGEDAAAEDVLGYVVGDVVTDNGRPIGHVKNLAVAPDCHRRGIGSRLLERALSVLVAGGACQAKLEVRVTNRAARQLYKGFGFTPTQAISGYYEDGEDALRLVANLADRASSGDR